MESKSCYKQNFVSHPSLKEPYPVPSPVTQERFNEALAYIPTTDDIFVCSYPKSGSTWMTNILMLMRDDGKPVEEGLVLQNKIPFLEFEGKAGVEKEGPKPRIIKTHLNFKFTPMNPKVKYIYLARNPKDCITSYYFHKKGMSEYQFADGKYDDFFDMFISGKTEYGDYFDLVGEWYEECKKRPNICFVLYEELKRDFEGELLRIAEFLGMDWKEKLLKNDKKILEKVKVHSSFKKMEENCELYAPLMQSRDLKFIRKGEVGDWRNYMKGEQSDLVNKKLKKAGEKYKGFDNVWDKYGCL